MDKEKVIKGEDADRSTVPDYVIVDRNREHQVCIIEAKTFLKK